jgi:hypothetical protein
MSETSIPAELQESIDKLRSLAAASPSTPPQALQDEIQAIGHKISAGARALAQSLQQQVSDPVARLRQPLTDMQEARAEAKSKTDAYAQQSVENIRLLSESMKQRAQSIASVARQNAAALQAAMTAAPSSSPPEAAVTAPGTPGRPGEALSWSEFLDSSGSGLVQTSTESIPKPQSETPTKPTSEKPGPGGVGWSTYLDQ